MPSKPKKGYFVRGHFVAEGSDLDLQLKHELKGGARSKTDLKRQSADLQTLGQALLGLGGAALARLGLPEALLDALAEIRRITDFEGRRRQMQYIGKLMRTLDTATLDAVRQALDEQARGPAQDVALLHEAERWRERLVADDDALAGWIETHPGTDVQQLRALVRQARRDFESGPPGQAPRQSKAWRELFQLVRSQLAAHGNADLGALAAAQSREEDA